MYPCGSQRHAAHWRGFESVKLGAFWPFVTGEETFGHFVHMRTSVVRSVAKTVRYLAVTRLTSEFTELCECEGCCVVHEVGCFVRFG